MAALRGGRHRFGAFLRSRRVALGLLLAVVVVIAPLSSICVNGARITRAKAARAELYDDLTDNVLGVADWIYSGRSEDYVGRFEDLEARVHRIDAEVKQYNRRRDVLLQILFGLCAVLLLVWAAVAFSPCRGLPDSSVRSDPSALKTHLPTSRIG